MTPYAPANPIVSRYALNLVALVFRRRSKDIQQVISVAWSIKSGMVDTSAKIGARSIIVTWWPAFKIPTAAAKLFVLLA
jgi:hypothetical protein